MGNKVSLSEVFSKRSMPEPNTGCTLWFGARNTDGYGNINRGGVTLKAHRLAYELANGPITDGLQVLHRCDNPSCVNPDHLFLGSVSDNMFDMHRKGRHLADRRNAIAASKKRFLGEGNPKAKLSRHEVELIKLGGISAKVAALVFGVSETQIYSIRRGVTWNG